MTSFLWVWTHFYNSILLERLQSIFIVRYHILFTNSWPRDFETSLIFCYQRVSQNKIFPCVTWLFAWETFLEMVLLTQRAGMFFLIQRYFASLLLWGCIVFVTKFDSSSHCGPMGSAASLQCQDEWFKAAGLQFPWHRSHMWLWSLAQQLHLLQSCQYIHTYINIKCYS